MIYGLIGIPWGFVGGLILVHTWDEHRAGRRGKPFAVSVTVIILATALALGRLLAVAQHRENQRQRGSVVLIYSGSREQ